MRTLWFVGWLGFAAVTVTTFGLFASGIWYGVGRLAALGGVLIVPMIAGGVAMTLWTAEAKPERLPLSRADRRRLRDEEARIAMEAEIKRMEREAGLS